MQPPCALLPHPRFHSREATDDVRLRTKIWGLVEKGQVGAKLLILGEMAGRQVHLTQNFEWQSHSRTQELTRHAQSGRTYRPNPCFNNPGKVRELVDRTSLSASQHGVARLNWPTRRQRSGPSEP